MSCLKPKQKTRRLKNLKERIKNLKKRKSQTESLKFKILFKIAHQISYLRDSIPSIIASITSNNPGRGQNFDEYIDRVEEKLYAKLDQLQTVYDNTEDNFNTKIDNIEKAIEQTEDEEQKTQNTPTC